MNEPTFSLINKNKLAKGESHNNSHSHMEGFERSKSNSKTNQTTYLMVYLALEKNLRILVQSCKKMYRMSYKEFTRQIVMPLDKFCSLVETKKIKRMPQIISLRHRNSKNSLEKLRQYKNSKILRKSRDRLKIYVSKR